MSSTTLIVNPEARGGWPRRNWPSIEPTLRQTLGDFDVCFTTREGEGRSLARMAVQKGAKLIIALGGDGTASEVAAGLLAEKDALGDGELPCSFGYLPCGTGGDLRRTLGTSLSIKEAAQAIATSKGRYIDAGRLDYIGNDGQPQRGYFINVASVGIGGLVDRYANRSSKFLGGKLTFFIASLRATLKYKNAAVRVRLDDRPVREHRIYLVAVANGRYCGGSMHVAPTAFIDDGLLEVVLFGDLSFTEALEVGRVIYKGNHLALPKVSCTRARVVSIEPCDPNEHVLLDVDGETPGRLPATWTVMPRALHLRG